MAEIDDQVKALANQISGLSVEIASFKKSGYSKAELDPLVTELNDLKAELSKFKKSPKSQESVPVDPESDDFFDFWGL